MTANLSRRSALAALASVPAAASASLAPAYAQSDLPDRAATVERAELMIEALRNSRTPIDENVAAAVLRYARTGDFDNGDDPDFLATLEFCSRHNQSLDWLFRGDVRGMIYHAARLSGISVVGDDPIYAVIEHHRAAYDRWVKEIDVGSNLEEALPRGQTRAYLEDEDHETDHPDWKEHQRRYFKLAHEVDDAAIEMTDVRPTTLGGAHALLRYIDSFNRGELGTSSEYGQWTDEILADQDFISKRTGKPVEMPWPFWVMRNVGLALETFITKITLTKRVA